MIFLLLILVSFSLSSSFKVNDVCKIEEYECKGVYDSNLIYREICEKNCAGKLMYKCAEDECTLDARACKEYLRMSNLIKSINRLQLFSKEMKKFNSKLNNVSKCQSLKYTFDKSDVCLNGKNCSYRERYTIRNSKYSLSKQIKCRCEGKHNYHCGTDHCSIHKRACTQFIANKSLNENKIALCENSNKSYERKIKIF